MINYIMSKRTNERCLIGIVLCIVVFILGYFILNHISTMEDPPLGNTIYILPPYISTNEQLEIIYKTIEKALEIV